MKNHGCVSGPLWVSVYGGEKIDGSISYQNYRFHLGKLQWADLDSYPEPVKRPTVLNEEYIAYSFGGYQTQSMVKSICTKVRSDTMDGCPGAPGPGGPWIDLKSMSQIAEKPAVLPYYRKLLN